MWSPNLMKPLRKIPPQLPRHPTITHKHWITNKSTYTQTGHLHPPHAPPRPRPSAVRGRRSGRWCQRRHDSLQHLGESHALASAHASLVSTAMESLKQDKNDRVVVDLPRRIISCIYITVDPARAPVARALPPPQQAHRRRGPVRAPPVSDD